MEKYSFKKEFESYLKSDGFKKYFIQEIAQKFAIKIQNETDEGKRLLGDCTGFKKFINDMQRELGL